MNEQQNTLTNITALLDYGVDPKTLKPWFSFAALSDLLTVRISGLVYMTFSRALEDRLSNDSEVMEVKCEVRQPLHDDLSDYAWEYNSLRNIPNLTIISIEGDLCITIICESYDVGIEPLSRK